MSKELAKMQDTAKIEKYDENMILQEIRKEIVEEKEENKNTQK